MAFFKLKKVEQTFGQKAVGVVVTQGLENTQVDKVTEVKTTFAKIIDTVNDIEVKSYLGNTLKGMAIRACIEASSMVVRIIVHKE